MDTFIEVGHCQEFKHGETVGGDMFLSQKIDGDERIVSVLSDGLGSGIKASVLATLTSVMATRFVSNYKDIRSTAEMIMKTLPVCSERRISYSTYTIVDVDKNSNLRIIEYGNPASLVFRGAEVHSAGKEKEQIEIDQKYDRIISFSTYDFEHGDRIVFFSDGVTQSGMGEATTPVGWGGAAVENFIKKAISEEPQISSRELAKQIVGRAKKIDLDKPKDDITCAVINLRKPRQTLLLSGPPVNQEKDSELARIVEEFKGKSILCGGTTANIVSRELNRPVTVDLKYVDPEIPPTARMSGVSLVTEGILTLCKVQELLENNVHLENERPHAATKLLEILLESDEIFFVIGTKINDVHQDPNIPVEIEIRRNIIKKIRDELETKYLKKVHLNYI